MDSDFLYSDESKLVTFKLWSDYIMDYSKDKLIAFEFFHDPDNYPMTLTINEDGSRTYRANSDEG